MTNSGCHEDQVSCTYPGAVSSPEPMNPPMSAAASSNATDQPSRASRAAAVIPLIPAPTTTASNPVPVMPRP